MPRKIDTAFVEYLPDLSAFTRTADRELNRAFAQMERTATASTNRVERTFDDMGREIGDAFEGAVRSSATDLERIGSIADEVSTSVGNDFQRSGEVAESAFAELRRSANTDLDRIDRNATATTAGIASKFGVLRLALGGAIFGIGAALTAGLGTLTTFGLMAAAQLEQVRVSFDSLLGSAQEGERVFRELQKFAAVTPFEFPDVAAAAKRFLAFAGNVGMSKDNLEDFLTVVGDLASVTGTGAEGLNRIVLAMGQIASKGRVQLEELMQISEAVPGFSAIGAIAQGLGVTTAKAMEMISAGEVNATDGINALLEGMKKFPGAAGAMEKQSLTLLGVFSTFKDTVSQALADAFAPVIPDIKKALTEATPVIGRALNTLAPLLGKLLATAAPILTGLIDVLIPVITPIIDALGPALVKIAPSLGPLGEALGEFTVALIPLLPVLTDLIVVTTEMTTVFLKLLTPAIRLFTPSLLLLDDVLTGLIGLMRGFNWTKTGNDIHSSFSKAGKAIGEFFGGIGRWFGRVIKFFRELPGRVLRFVMDLPRMLINLFSSMFDEAVRIVGMGIGLIIFNFTQLPGLIVGALIKLPGFLVDIMTRAWNNAFLVVTTIGTKIVDFITGLPARIIAGITSLGPAIGRIFTNMWDNAKRIVSNAITSIVNFVRGMPKRIGDFAMQIGSSIVGFFKSFLNNAIARLNEGIARVDAILPGSLPRIPMLAHGGVAFGPAMIGEDPRTGPEAAIPLGDARALAMLRDALGGAGGITFAPGSVVVNVAGDVSPQKAKQIGTQVGTGIADVLRARGVRLAVRAI